MFSLAISYGSSHNMNVASKVTLSSSTVDVADCCSIHFLGHQSTFERASESHLHVMLSSVRCVSGGGGAALRRLPQQHTQWARPVVQALSFHALKGPGAAHHWIPKRMASAGTTKHTAAVAYGAPFTTSITFMPAAATDSTGATVFTFKAAIPELPTASVDVYPRDTLQHVTETMARQLGVPSVVALFNGRRLTEAELGTFRVLDTFGGALEFEVGGVRYSVNEGIKLAATGRTVKRAMWQSYSYILFGGCSALLLGLWFWQRVLPKEKQKGYGQ